jgi:hypothetical protein
MVFLVAKLKIEETSHAASEENIFERKDTTAQSRYRRR